MNQSSDKQEALQLIKSYFKGDKQALEVLVKQYLQPVYGYVCTFVGNSSDAEDITQEAFVRAWKNLKKFDQQRNFKTWIFAIAKNAALDFIKKKKSIPFSDFEDESGKNTLLDTLADSAPLPDKLLEQKDLLGLLSSAIEKLSAKYRTVLSLRYDEELNFREISESLGEPLHTVKSRHRRALLMLKELLLG